MLLALVTVVYAVERRKLRILSALPSVSPVKMTVPPCRMYDSSPANILSLTTLSAAAGLSGKSSAAKPYEPSSSSSFTPTELKEAAAAAACKFLAVAFSARVLFA